MIRSHTAHDIYELNGETPETLVTGQPTDISQLVEHPWYGWVKFWDVTLGKPHVKEVYGRWLGPSIDVGPAMTAKILKANGQVIHAGTYRSLTEDELTDPVQLELRKEFDESIKKTLGSAHTQADYEALGYDTPTPELYADDFEGTHQPTPDAEDPTPETGDNYIGAEVNLPFQGTMMQGRVKCRARNEEGELFGTANEEKPILDTRIYQVEFPDGSEAEYAANVIAENMHAQCEPDGSQRMLLKAIVDHRKDDTALTKDTQYVEHNGKRHKVKTTKGWWLCPEWDNGSTAWVRLAEMKDSFPVEVAEYAVAMDIADEPAFAWWVPQVLKRRDRIIAAVKSRYFKRTHKFGLEVPKTVRRALEIDKANGNTLWEDAIKKEMKNVGIAFKPVDSKEEVPSGYQYMDCHLVFDIKIDGFKRKARMVAGGNMVSAPAVSTYASVVARDTVRIALTIAALNDLEVQAGDIQNAFLCAPCEEKVYTKLGPEFGANEGKYAIIVRALYGLASASASFSRHIADCMRHLGYSPCRADPDLWWKANIRPEDGFKYYSYILLYVDDVLAIGHDAKDMIERLDKYFTMKEESKGKPDMYLGAKLAKCTLDNGVECWAMSPAKYVWDSIANVEKYLADKGLPKLKNKARAPWITDYASELDTSKDLGQYKDDK